MKTSFLPSRAASRALFLAVTVLLAAAGCSLPQAQVDPTRYYVLSTPAAKPASGDGAHWRVALRTVQIPSFLRGKSMQVRSGTNEVIYADESRWAESLEAGVSRVLRESLEGREAITNVVSSAGEEHDFDIVVSVLRCEGDRAAGVARFTAVIEIYSTAPGAPRIARDTFTTEVQGWNGQDYGQLAQKLSEAVEAFSNRIAALLPPRT